MDVARLLNAARVVFEGGTQCVSGRKKQLWPGVSQPLDSGHGLVIDFTTRIRFEAMANASDLAIPKYTAPNPKTTAGS